jgi:hypothetical protein
VGKMRIKTVEACLIAFLTIMLVLMSTTPVAMANGISGKLWLAPVPPGTYVDDSDDAWFTESNVTTDTSFDLEIYYHHGGDIHHLYLLVAVDRNPENNVTINVSGIPVGPYDGVITSNNNALITETDPDYEYPGHGIYKYGSSTHFEVVEVLNVTAGDAPLSAGNTLTVHVNITSINLVKVHFDAVGVDSNYKAIAFVPPSHDVTHQVPEFTTIAIPVASILGLLFFFNHRKRRKKLN